MSARAPDLSNAGAAGPPLSGGAPGVPVWDRGVRLFHWSLLAAVAVALLTGYFGSKPQLDIHLIAGAGVAFLLTFRIVWGFSGSTYARFSSFLRGPRVVLAHMRDLLTGRAEDHVGHNPVGSVMIAALLVCLTVLLISGLIALGGVVKDGPLAPYLSYAIGRSAREIHEFLSYGLMGLIGLHVLGVVIESLRTRENLARSMVTGIKRERAHAHSAAKARAHPWFAASIVAMVVGLFSAATVHQAAKPALGVPTAPLDAVYLKECSSCHSPHHPSVAPVATWAAIFSRLGDHFGDNAELPEATATALATYAAAHAAERYDTRAANLLRGSTQDGLPRMTTTPGWLRLHREVDDKEFAAKAVGGKANCSKCHRDAEAGVFSPRAIILPKETKS